MGRLLLLLFGFGAGVAAAAQPFVGDLLAVDAQGTFYRFTRATGRVASLRVSSGALVGPVVDVDNRTVLLGDVQNGRVLRVDPDTLAVVGTAATGLGRVVGLTLDPDGNLLVVDGRRLALLRVHRRGGVTTLRDGRGWLKDPRGGLALDVQTTDLLVQETSAALGAPLYRLTLDGRRLTTLARGYVPAYQLVVHVPTGDTFVASAAAGDVAIYRLHEGAGTATSWLPATPGLAAAASLAADRSSGIAQHLLVGAFRTSARSRGLYMVDVATKKVTRLADLPATLTGVAFGGSRNLATVRQARGLWEVRVSFPQHPDHQFFVLPSLHGVRPGQPLPDGRRAYLVPDGVTAHVIYRGDIFPCTWNFRGLLDGRGSTRARLDLRSVLPWAKGLVVWLLAVAVERKAPWHIVAVSDPVAVQLL